MSVLPIVISHVSRAMAGCNWYIYYSLSENARIHPYVNLWGWVALVMFEWSLDLPMHKKMSGDKGI